VIISAPVCAVTAVIFTGTLPTNIVVPAAVSTGVTVQLTGYSVDPSNCGANLTQTVLVISTSPLSLLLTSSLSVNIDSATGILSFVSTSLSDVGTYTIMITTNAINATLDQAYLPLFQTITLDVVSSCTSMIMTSSQVTQVTYIIGDLPVSVPMPTYTGYPAGC